MAHEARLIVETGPCRGQKFVIEDGGSARAGRSSSSDIPLNDPSVSRFHCRIFFKPGKGLWIADLGSANQTLVNGKAVQEAKLNTSDRIEIGDSILTILSDGSDAPVATTPSQPASAVAQPASVLVKPAIPALKTPLSPSPAEGEVDLGLAATREKRTGAKPNVRLILLILAMMAMSVLVVFVFVNMFAGRPGDTHVGPAEFRLEDSELRYEKVDGSASNIFQSVLTIQGTMAGIEIHDVADKKHYKKPLAEVDRKVLEKLWESVKKTGVFDLRKTEYMENSQGTYNLKDLTVFMGTNAYRLKVLNAAEPPELENARKTLEAFGKNEFGLSSWAYPRGELVRLAGESMQLGLKLYDEKNVSYGNLFKALRAMDEAVVFLETVDPKPDFYRELVTARETCEKELNAVVSDLRFQADRARKIKDWQEAVNALRILCETVPDRLHKDYQDAEKDLVDAEQRIKK